MNVMQERYAAVQEARLLEKLRHPNIVRYKVPLLSLTFPFTNVISFIASIRIQWFFTSCVPEAPHHKPQRGAYKGGAYKRGAYKGAGLFLVLLLVQSIK